MDDFQRRSEAPSANQRTDYGKILSTGSVQRPQLGYLGTSPPRNSATPRPTQLGPTQLGRWNSARKHRTELLSLMQLSHLPEAGAVERQGRRDCRGNQLQGQTPLDEKSEAHLPCSPNTAFITALFYILLTGLPFSSRGKRSVRPGLTATAGYLVTIPDIHLTNLPQLDDFQQLVWAR